MQDHLGSTTALTDSSGNFSTSITYDAYGNSAPNSLTRFGYTGRELDADTGLMYYRARWYDPLLGRFISEDPIGFAGGVNWYAYVGNNPMGYTDPLGLTGEEAVQNLPQYISWIGAAAAAIGAAAAPAAAGAAIGATFAALWYGAYLTGDWLAHRPWNPFVNGPLNPFGNPNPPHQPLRDLSKCESRPKDLPLPTPPPPPRNDFCFQRWLREDAKCEAWSGLGWRVVSACKERASNRRNLCVANGGMPHPEEPGEYSPFLDRP